MLVYWYKIEATWSNFFLCQKNCDPHPVENKTGLTLLNLLKNKLMTLPCEASAYPTSPPIKNVPSLGSVWPLKRSQKSLRRKLVPIPVVVSGGGNYVYFARRMSLYFVFSVFRWIAKLAVNCSQKFYLVYLVFLCNILRMCQYFQNEFSVERSILAILVAAYYKLNTAQTAQKAWTES